MGAGRKLLAGFLVEGRLFHVCVVEELMASGVPFLWLRVPWKVLGGCWEQVAGRLLG